MTQATTFQLYLQVTSPNLLYNDYKDRWQFYLESYMGGDEYRSAGHLSKYVNENAREYQARLYATPLDNHCRSVVSVYTSFLFREAPDRELGSLEYDSTVEDFMEDADLDGRSLDQFMKEVGIWSNVFGHCWVILSKPNVGAVTMADELESGVRPYVNLLTPLAVIDWKWNRTPMGRYELTYFKYVEDTNPNATIIKEWTNESITTYEVDNEQKVVNSEQVEVNGLGRIPAVISYGTRSPVRGIGASSISDIADHQRKIYNELSEVEQSIRLNGHPTVVKTADVEMSAGAGSIALMPDNMDPGLKPFMLNVSTDIGAIYNSIAASVAAIDKMANTGAIRTSEARSMSGIAMRTEFELLNAKLSEMADNLELAEEQLWQFYAVYQGRVWDGEIEYPGSFNIQDEDAEINRLKVAKETATDPAVLRVIDEQLLEVLDSDKSRLPFIDPNPQPGRLYEDGEEINANLPDAYQPASNAEVPAGQACSNCEYYKPGELYCTKFDAPVRAVYWCAKWEQVEQDL